MTPSGLPVADAPSVSIVRAVDGAALAVHGRVLQRQPGTMTVELDEGIDVPATTPLVVVVHVEPPVIVLATASPTDDPNTYVIRLYERRA